MLSLGTMAQKNKNYQLLSPDGNMILKIAAGDQLEWSVIDKTTPIVSPSTISLQLETGEVLGKKVAITSTKTEKVNTSFVPIHYKKNIITDIYNQLTINCKGNYGIIFRAYNDGVAYRFFTKKKGEITIVNEEANFNFDKDYKCFIPFVRDFRGTEQYLSLIHI